MPKLTKLKSLRIPKSRLPIWEGPDSSGPNGGISFSNLSRFLCCRERFRLLVVEGLKPEEQFNPRIEYGNLWHACEEAFAAGGNPIVNNPVSSPPWEQTLRQCAIQLAARYPLQQEQVQHWYRVCQIQFPLYVRWWKNHPDMLKRTPLLEEQVFAIDYELPSGRHVKLRGKFDSVDLIGEGKKARVWLQENKTKGDIDQHLMQRNLTFDLQTMLYAVALREYDLAALENPKLDKLVSLVGAGNMFGGIRYNVIRRPLSGGKHTIRKHKPTKSNPLGETDDEFYTRLAGLIENESLEPDGSHYYFSRWNVDILPHHIEEFRHQCLNPILEQLWDWWEYITINPNDVFNPTANAGRHFRFPYGVYNPTLEGNSSDVDEYLATGSEVGLQRVDNLFPEL